MQSVSGNDPSIEPGRMSSRRRRFRLENPIVLLVLTGMIWAVVVIGYQTMSADRIPFRRPDLAIPIWTPRFTLPGSQDDRPYLLDPFMNRQVSWDSEFYLSIAVGGYDDPLVRQYQVTDGPLLSLNYAFFPLYPTAMRVVSLPLAVLGKNDVATATLAGVLVSVAGTIAAMIALYDLTRHEMGEGGGMRTAFYLLIFPSSFFFTQVYSEGLFVGLAFGSLAFIQRNKLWPAAALAALAVWTRSIGIVLVLPLLLAWLIPLLPRWKSLTRQNLTPGLTILLPVISFVLWRLFMGSEFDQIQKNFFQRDILDFEQTWAGWRTVFDLLFAGDTISQTRVYFALECGSVILAFAACLLTWRRYPIIAAFSLIVLLVSIASGAPQSMIRYVLAVPSLFILLSTWGRNPLFDRAWMTGSLMLMGLLAALFAQDMWVG